MKSVKCRLKHDMLGLNVMMEISESDIESSYAFWRAINRYAQFSVGLIGSDTIERLRLKCKKEIDSRPEPEYPGFAMPKFKAIGWWTRLFMRMFGKKQTHSDGSVWYSRKNQIYIPNEESWP